MAIPASPSLLGKTVLVTGATAGIGLVTARELARRGARVVLVGRHIEKTEHARQAVQAAAPDAPEPEALLCDLSLIANVRDLAAEFGRRFDKLDVLVNNAGIMPGPLTITREGHEMSWATNHLAPFALTNLLIPQLVEAGNARVVTVASEAHWLGQIESSQEARNDPEKYSSFTAYCDSKLANILFTNELAHRLEFTGVTANSLHPGIVDTTLINPNTSTFMKTMWWLARPFMIDVERGAQTTVFLASAPEAGRISGRYFKGSRPARCSSRAQSRADASRLWRISADETGIE
ncbi:SDR family oxidoreductase [Hymenobacter sp. BT175]|uniref:SDR family oxidoreductase n=1 Tax=Hymenobacter translucens TaxID=2886507 RepID=UPI001D0EE54E|nr:SDR family oxidoreductase [Hymenobacter translucens]MCC2546324.1 SDR family oxidoreductase [Hymenobacter translucens]